MVTVSDFSHEGNGQLLGRHLEPRRCVQSGRSVALGRRHICVVSHSPQGFIAILPGQLKREPLVRPFAKNCLLEAVIPETLQHGLGRAVEAPEGRCM